MGTTYVYASTSIDVPVRLALKGGGGKLDVSELPATFSRHQTGALWICP